MGDTRRLTQATSGRRMVQTSSRGWKQRASKSGDESLNLDCGNCLVRDWRLADKPSLLRHANNRNVWRNLAHRFPHPYTEADADSWLGLIGKGAERTNWAIDVA